MDSTSFPMPTWYHASTLKERAALRRATADRFPDAPMNADRAGRRMQRWRSQAPFTKDASFTQRLAADSITEEELLYLLGEPIEAVPGRFLTPPQWWEDLVEAFSRAVGEPLPPDAVGGPGRMSFLYVIEPLIIQARERLRQGVQALSRGRSELPFDPDTIDDLLARHLAERLVILSARTLVLELNVARLQGVLDGATPEERFQSFLQRLRRPEHALALFEEYPVLARQLRICMDQWVTFNLEFLRHLCADWETIRAVLSPQQNPGVLVAVEAGLGDSHRGGRSVRMVRFASGVQVVYKPRPLVLDVRFQELLGWLNERGDHPPFRTLKVLDRGDHGWVEFVAPEGCTSAEEVRHFYRRQGGYLALLYGLEATDFHCENLVAAGEHPVLLDLEALFHPRVGAAGTTQADDLADRTLTFSVLRVGLLPYRLGMNAEGAGVDISALGAMAGQLTPEGVPIYEGVGTDEMRLVRKRIEMPGTGNRPTLNGTAVNVPDYAEEIADGFTAVYRLLLRDRQELLAETGPLAVFAEDEVRVLLRHTRTYAQLLAESFHPDVLRDALDRDRLFDRLWVGSKSFPDSARVLAAEREDLQNGDIPLFTARPSSRDLWTSSQQRIPDFFDEPALAHVRRRLRQLSSPDLEKQLWFLRASLVTLSTDPHRLRQPAGPWTVPESSAGRERLLHAARAVGDRLEALALRGDTDAAWIGLSPTGQHWSLAPAGLDLYDGLPGIALFLGYLGSILGDDRYTTLAQGALSTMRRRVDRDRGFLTSIGGFTGWGGVVYTLTHLGTLWRQPALFHEALALVDRLSPLIERDEYLDLMAGAAGCICALLSLYRCVPSPATLAAAIRCGDHLITRAQPMAQGIGWVPPVGGKSPLAGLSHGAAGMAWALLQLAALTSEERFREAALAAIAYERSLFSPESGNWADLRDDPTPPAAGTERKLFLAWCHGAPGIGLARLGAFPLLDDAAVRAEVLTALQTTLAQGFGANHSLCHGDLGNLELLLQASQTLADPQWSAHVSCLAGLVLQSISRDGWRCGNPFHVESPGLMTGLAGIGYGLLRLAEPAQVPSVLLLAPPAGRGTLPALQE